MPRYIDVENIKWTYSFGIDDEHYGMCVPISDIYRSIVETPTADVVEVRRGKWLINADGYHPYCSECKLEPQGHIMTDFCPNCGADMRGKNTHRIFVCRRPAADTTGYT